MVLGDLFRGADHCHHCGMALLLFHRAPLHLHAPTKAGQSRAERIGNFKYDAPETDGSPDTCCRGASTETSVEAQEAAAGTSNSKDCFWWPLATRTMSCPGYLNVGTIL